MSQEVEVGRQGRLVIPAAIRKTLGIQEGTHLVARVEGDRLILESRQAILERLRGSLAGVEPGTSWVEELLAERRAEAKREMGA